MPPRLTGVAWAQIRYDYEHTERPIEEICAEHGISSGTLRDRVRRWGWTRRREPIPREGPPPLPAPRIETPPFAPVGGECVPVALTALEESSPHPAASPSLGDDPPPAGEGKEVANAPPLAAVENAGAATEAADGAIVPRLESAVARVLPAIEATVAKLAAGGTHPRELERAARALAALTRTLRELSNLLRQRQEPAPSDPARDDASADDYSPEDIDEFRRELARRMDAIVAARGGDVPGDA